MPKAKEKVFYSFHYKQDVMRVQNIRQMGVLEGNEPVKPNDWEEIKKKGNDAVKKWIDEEIARCSCVIVLIGAETANRKWVKYEIERAWNTNKGLMAIYIHNLSPVNESLAIKGVEGRNPLRSFWLRSSSMLDEQVLELYTVAPVKNPSERDAYDEIHKNLACWVQEAIDVRKKHARYTCVPTTAERIFGKSMEH